MNEDDICVQIFEMPSQISGDQYIQIPSNYSYLIGQHFNRETEEFEVVYYYAVLDERSIVTSVEYYTEQQTETSTLISITYTQYSDGLVGQYWNGTEFVDPPIAVLSVASTDEINYKSEDKWLSTKLDEMDSSISQNASNISTISTDLSTVASNLSTVSESLYTVTSSLSDLTTTVAGKANASHTHEITDVTGLESALSGKASATHTHTASDLSGVVKTVNGTAPDASGNIALEVTSGMTAAEILAAVKTVDGANSGLDADTLDGIEASGFATANHNHDSVYAAVNHTHDSYLTETALDDYAKTADVNTALSGKSDTTHNHDTVYAPISHTHQIANVTGLETALAGKSDSTHNHDSDYSAINHNHDTVYAAANHTHTEYAASDHTHSGYATTASVTAVENSISGKADASHTHSMSDVTGLSTALDGKADTSHTHSGYASASDVSALQTAMDGKASVNHTHSEYASVSDLETVENALSGKASSTHTHAQSDISGLTEALSGKSDTSHTHSVATTTANGFMSSTDKAKIDGVETGANNTVVDSALSSTSTNPVQNKVVNAALSGKAASSHTHTLDDVSETDSKKIMTAAERTKLSGIADGANNYTLPTASTTLGGVKTTSTVTSTSGLTACPIISGVPYYQDTNTTYSNATTSAAGLMSATDKAKLDGIATGATNITVDSSLSSTSTNPVQNKVINTALAGKAASSHTHAVSDISGTLPISKGGTGATTAAAALTNFGITATAAELNKMDGVTATTAELNYVDGVTSNIQTQLNGKADADHTHQIYYSSQSVSSYKLIYIATDGDDSNNGFTQTAPMATIKGALKKYADTYKFIDLRLADGTYTENIGTIAIDACNLSIRSISDDKDKVTINMTSAIEFSVNEARMYNMTLNVTDTGVRNVCVNAGVFYAYAVRFNVPTSSNYSCVNVYNGTSCFLMNCILNSGTGSTTGACVYGNQAMIIKAINCTSERTVATAFYANNGSEIVYSDTITATNKTKESFYGKCKLIRENEYSALWSGRLYMKSDQTVTPSNKLSECRNGWLLLWSDYDPDSSSANDADFVTTIIPKASPSGGTWNGNAFLCDIPRYIGSDTSDVSTEKRIIKTLYVYDDCINGASHNSLADRNDVVLRAVYEI